MNVPVVISHLYKTYFRRSGLFGRPDAFPVLQDINLAIGEGRVLGLVGESGCGKSTLCKVLLGIEKPTAGSVSADGKKLDELSKSEWKNLRRVMQVVYQDPYSSLDPRMNIRQILEEPLEIHGLYKDRAARKKFLKDLLEDVGLGEEHLNRYPHEFSGGQRQRVCIARALVTDPRILVADEPVSALDVSVQAQILNLLKDVKSSRGLTMLFITHDFSVARFLCDDVAVMYKGRIVERAPADRLFAAPLHPYTRTLLDAVPRADHASVREDVVPTEEPSRVGWQCPYAPRCPYAREICRTAPFNLKETAPDRFCACAVLPFGNTDATSVKQDNAYENQ